MNEELKILYEELGYTGPVPDPSRRERGGIGEPSPDEKEHGLPPLDDESLKALETSLHDRPRETLALIRAHFPTAISDDEIRGAVAAARSAFDAPIKFVEQRRAERQQPDDDRRDRGGLEDSPPVPDDMILYPEIPILPDNHRFEPKKDTLGWIVNTGVRFVRHTFKKNPERAPFPAHDQHPSGFIYEMQDRQGRAVEPEQTIRVALFSDFGTGLYHSRYIARLIAAEKPDYAIHLGDVYYAGRAAEFTERFEAPLSYVLETTRFFAMNANHEMYSGAFPYFDFLRRKQRGRVGWAPQEQEGSYFCLRGPRYQIIGIDTAYHQDGRHNQRQLNEWLGGVLHDGRNAAPAKTNILLSPNEPYDLGTQGFTALYNDLQEFIQAGLIDNWFWGNTHYCALYGKSEFTPFVGSCIGHGGHPIYLNDVLAGAAVHPRFEHKGQRAAPLLWVDDSTRFPKASGIRQEMANHGFCMLELRPEGVQLTYRDWQNRQLFQQVISI